MKYLFNSSGHYSANLVMIEVENIVDIVLIGIKLLLGGLLKSCDLNVKLDSL